MDCLNCNARLLETAVLPDSTATAVVRRSAVSRLDYDEKTGCHFILCTTCDKKNGFRRIATEHGRGGDYKLDRILS